MEINKARKNFSIISHTFSGKGTVILVRLDITRDVKMLKINPIHCTAVLTSVTMLEAPFGASNSVSFIHSLVLLIP